MKISQILGEENCGTISVALTVGIAPRVEAGSGTILSKLATTPILGKCRPIKGWREGGRGTREVLLWELSGQKGINKLMTNP